MSTAGITAGLTAGLAALGTAAASLGASGKVAAYKLGEDSSKELTDAEKSAQEAAAKAGALVGGRRICVWSAPWTFDA